MHYYQQTLKHEPERKNELKFGLFEIEVPTEDAYLDPEWWGVKELDPKIVQKIDSALREKGKEYLRHDILSIANKIAHSSTAWDKCEGCRVKLSNPQVIELCEIMGVDEFLKQSALYKLPNGKILISEKDLIEELI